MELFGKHIGFAMTGSYCTFGAVLPQLLRLRDEGAQLHPIVSENVSKTTTRFMKKEELYDKLESASGREVIDTIVKAEPIGPGSLLDLLIVAPCTGNTAAKIAFGITDTPVVMAVKAQMRNAKPVLIALATNDALGMCAKSIGMLMNSKNLYFVPVAQDDTQRKANSLVANMGLIAPCAKKALDGVQEEPLLYNI